MLKQNSTLRFILEVGWIRRVSGEGLGLEVFMGDTDDNTGKDDSDKFIKPPGVAGPGVAGWRTGAP